MWINFLILFQLVFFEDYKSNYEEYIKNKERCEILKEKLEKTGKEVGSLRDKNELEKAKKLLKESHYISIEYTNCQRELKIKEKKLEKLLPKAREELEEKIEEIISKKVSLSEDYDLLISLIEKLKFLKSEYTCNVLSLKEFKIEEPQEITGEKLKLMEAILFDLKKEEGKTKDILEKLQKEKNLRENLFQFMKKMEMEGSAILDTRLSEENVIFELEKIDKEIENCKKTLDIYKSIIEYWEGEKNKIYQKR